MNSNKNNAQERFCEIISQKTGYKYSRTTWNKLFRHAGIIWGEYEINDNAIIIEATCHLAVCLKLFEKTSGKTVTKEIQNQRQLPSDVEAEFRRLADVVRRFPKPKKLRQHTPNNVTRPTEDESDAEIYRRGKEAAVEYLFAATIRGGCSEKEKVHLLETVRILHSLKDF